jgi:NCS1 family nucleobase:cation symporter-1
LIPVPTSPLQLADCSKGYLQIKDLYSAKKTSPYYFTLGFNWRAYAAYICGILINIVGFVGAIGKEVPVGAQYIYNLNFFCGFIVASATYYLFSRLSPIPATSDGWMEVGDQIIDPSLAYGPESSDYDETTPGLKVQDPAAAAAKNF